MTECFTAMSSQIMAAIARGTLFGLASLAMPRKRRQQDGDQRLQSFRAEAVGRLQQHHQSLSNLSATTGGMPPIGRRLRLMTAEHTDRMLAVIAGDRDKLIQDPLLVGPAT